MLLKAHFESLNPKWHDQESVMTLLSEISHRLADPSPLTNAERMGFESRIRLYLDKNTTRATPRPMQSAGSKQESGSKRKTGS